MLFWITMVNQIGSTLLVFKMDERKLRILKHKTGHF